jgi:hypothetical protein
MNNKLTVGVGKLIIGTKQIAVRYKVEKDLLNSELSPTMRTIRLILETVNGENLDGLNSGTLVFEDGVTKYLVERVKGVWIGRNSEHQCSAPTTCEPLKF